MSGLAHLNGNIHIRMHQKLALALNVEYGRLKGWLKNGQEASEELNNNQAKEYFKAAPILFSIPFLMIETKN